MSVKTMETFSADKKESKKRKLPLKKKLMNHRFHPSGVSEKVVSQILDVDWELKIDDPGIFLEMRPPVDIHNAMIVTAAFLPVGLVVGATPNDSTANLLAWIRNVVTNVCPQSEVPVLGGTSSGVAFHHLTVPEYMACQNQLNVIGWANSCHMNAVDVGRMYLVSSAGRGYIMMSEVLIGPFFH